MRSLARVAILVLVAVVAAVITNVVRSDHIRWVVSRQDVYPPPTTQQAEARITRDRVVVALSEGAILIDARVAEKYHNGHIPMAHNLPAESAEENLGKVYEWVSHPDQFVIVYCGGAECDESLQVYELLKRSGFTNLWLYFGGWQDWTGAGNTVETSGE